METLIENNQVSIIENSLEVLKTGPEILMANQTRKEKALAVGRNILATIGEEGMTPETDERANKYLANVSAANKSMKESRAGVTQIMDQLKKMFTEVENDLDVKKTGTIPSQIQAHRDQYAKDVAAEQERKRKQAEMEAAKAKEAIDIKYQMEANYKEQFGQYLLLRKTKMQNGFNAITLDRFEELSGKLKGLSFLFQFNYENRFISTGVRYHSAEELKKFSDAVIIDNESELEATFLAEMNLLKDELVDKLPSKLAELQEQKRLDDEAKAQAEAARIAEEKRQAEIAQANAKEKKRLEAEAAIARQKEKERQEEMRKKQEAALAEQKRREQEEADRMKAEAEEQKRKSDLEAEVKKQGEQTMVMFEQEAALAEAAPTPEARQGYEIKILHQVGYTQIFALWFESEGKNLPMDKIGRTSCDQMKAWAEKHAHKTGTKIDSKFLKYEESFKAVNRKAK